MRDMERPLTRAGMVVPPTIVLWLGWMVWLPFLFPKIGQLLGGTVAFPVDAATLAITGVFIVVYAVATWVNARELKSADEARRPALPWCLAATLAILASAATIVGSAGHVAMSGTFIYTAAYVAGALRPQRAVVVVNAGLAVGGGLLSQTLVGEGFLMGLFLITVVTFVTAAWSGIFVLARRLHAAQLEIEFLAADAERARIARDLHDLLGQKLSVIALKSQLARRTVGRDEEHARREMAEVEETARTLLQDVRNTVDGYHRLSLAAELSKAREILLAAGMEFSIEGALPSAPEAVDQLFASVLREGVTNVVRHSQARHCVLKIEETPRSWILRLSDDGVAQAGPPGNGLTGLAARASALGGQLLAAPGPTGFVVTVEVPVSGAAT